MTEARMKQILETHTREELLRMAEECDQKAAQWDELGYDGVALIWAEKAETYRFLAGLK